MTIGARPCHPGIGAGRAAPGRRAALAAQHQGAGPRWPRWPRSTRAQGRAGRAAPGRVPCVPAHGQHGQPAHGQPARPAPARPACAMCVIVALWHTWHTLAPVWVMWVMCAITFQSLQLRTNYAGLVWLYIYGLYTVYIYIFTLKSYTSNGTHDPQDGFFIGEHGVGVVAHNAHTMRHTDTQFQVVAYVTDNVTLLVTLSIMATTP